MGGILVTFHDLCVLPHSFGTEAMGRRSEVMVCYTRILKMLGLNFRSPVAMGLKHGIKQHLSSKRVSQQGVRDLSGLGIRCRYQCTKSKSKVMNHGFHGC